MCRNPAISSSIGLHQVAYETAASSLQELSACSVYMSFYTIVANYNEESAAATQARIRINTHK